MSADHDFAWKYLPEQRKALNGAAKLVRVPRLGEEVWVPIRDVTPAELSLLMAFARAAESRRNRQFTHLRKRR